MTPAQQKKKRSPVILSQHGVTVPLALVAYFRIIAADKPAATTVEILDTNTKPVLSNTRESERSYKASSPASRSRFIRISSVSLRISCVFYSVPSATGASKHDGDKHMAWKKKRKGKNAHRKKKKKVT